MTWSDCAAELQPRHTADGSLTFWSERFGQCFHNSAGARREAELTYVLPAQLERFQPGTPLVVVDVCVGLGYNSAALLEAAQARGLLLHWEGLELDPAPLRQALAEPSFRQQWQPDALSLLTGLDAEGRWQTADGSGGSWWLGDARIQLPTLLQRRRHQCDLVLLDAFSPGCCPELWTHEFLSALSELLSPSGRLLTYCAAAAVRSSLQQSGLQLVNIGPSDASQHPRRWSGGTAASWQNLACDGSSPFSPLGPMELEHLRTRAALVYRDPSGCGTAASIQAERQVRQAHSTAMSTSQWRRRWQLD